eukprot:CAMPEP_0171611304 /NCGR_PEP_ID=MMETSP0990-20121206/10549_1 /TAXON_ID=483369 /ORGANISM="non described non described, Strain CCMP2098" /LENGTH=48 /DNA_ID= /DNA_START= /DNA_END= /DNA_ORIENTATION=
MTHTSSARWLQPRSSRTPQYAFDHFESCPASQMDKAGEKMEIDTPLAS